MTVAATYQREAPAKAMQITYRSPRQSDAVRIDNLVKACPPLDVNSTYAYQLVCTHFAETSIVAEIENQPAGFISAYLEPQTPTVLFVWQVAVSPHARGRGIGLGMLRWLLDRPACGHVRHLETTITPSNESSWHMFRGLAGRLHVPCDVSPHVSSEDLGGAHEPEHLVRIGPIPSRAGSGHEQCPGGS
jgi:L-2,4-diaminobutyric acid acetyltransferase